MADEKPSSPRPIPFSGYFDLALSVLFPLIGVSFALLLLFWFAVRPSVPDSAIGSWVLGAFTVGLVVGVVNAVRFYRKTYRK
jgi:hypothetical protein